MVAEGFAFHVCVCARACVHVRMCMCVSHLLMCTHYHCIDMLCIHLLSRAPVGHMLRACVFECGYAIFPELKLKCYFVPCGGSSACLLLHSLIHT